MAKGIAEKKIDKQFLIKTNITCGDSVEVFKSDETTMIFVPTEYSVKALEEAHYYASKYCMDLWVEGKCDSFGIYLVDRVDGLEIPHVYSTVFLKSETKGN
jgi:hypothetical protein